MHKTHRPPYDADLIHLSSKKGEIRATFDIIPRVTDWESPAGLPMAKQTSPTSTASESPNVATVRGLLPLARPSILRPHVERPEMGTYSRGG